MNRDLLTQLTSYGEYCDDRQGSVSVEEITQANAPDPSEPTVTFVATGVEPHENNERVRLDELTVEYLVPRENSTARVKQKRWIGALTAAAAIVLVIVVGLVVIADGNSGDVVTAPASSPSTTSPVSSGVADPVVSPGVLDPVSSYRWFRIPYDEAVFGEQFEEWMGSVTVGGPGLVAVGSAVWTSVDGLTWSRVPDDEAIFADAPIHSVTAGGPGLVAVGVAFDEVEPGTDAAAVWTSPDGFTWSRVPHDEAVFGDAAMTSVTAGGPGLVAVGWDGQPHGGESNAAVWTSPDGFTWSRVPHDEAIFGEVTGAWMHSVTVGGPGLVAVGEWARADQWGAAVWTSVDGLTWSRVPDDEAVFGNAAMRSATAGGPGVVAVGRADRRGAAVWTSPDGIVWSRVPHDDAIFGNPNGTVMESVTVGGPGLVAVGWDTYGASVWTSIDGINWSWVQNPNPVFGPKPKPLLEIRSIIAGGPGLVAVGSNLVVPTFGATDSDAAVWVARFED
jgi:hypothetical protein